MCRLATASPGQTWRERVRAPAQAAQRSTRANTAPGSPVWISHAAAAHGDLFVSWKFLAIYVLLVIWTPIWVMRPLPPLRLDDIWLALTLMNSVLFVDRQSIKRPGLPFYSFLLLGFVLFFSTFQSSVSSYYRVTMADVFDSLVFVRLAFVYLISSRINLDTKSIHRIAVVAIVSTLAMAVLMYYQAHGIAPIADMSLRIWSSGDKYVQRLLPGSVPRAIGTIGNPNYVGLFLVTTLLLSIAMVYRSSKWWLAGCIVAFTMVYAGVFLTASRTTMTAMAGCSAMLIALLARSAKQRGYTLLCVSAVCLAVWLDVSIVGIPTRVIDYTDALLSGQSLPGAQSRLDLWIPALRTLWDSGRILLGLGAEARTIDSGFLFILYRQGLLGLIAVIAIWAWALARAARGILGRASTPNARYVCSVLLALLVSFLVLEVTAQALFYSKTGPVIALTIGIAARAYDLWGTSAAQPNPERPGESLS